MNNYTTKVTRTKDGYFCRVSFKGTPIVQAKVSSRIEIGAAFRDLLRTLDKLGGDKFTNAARYRKWKKGNLTREVKHEWLEGT
jgi:hypothetical protein